MATKHRKGKIIMNQNKNEQAYLVQKIRTQYTEKQHTELDELKALDGKVKRPAKIFAYIFGCAAALIMGAGMSLIMSDFSKLLGAAAPVVGTVAGIVGIVMLACAYPVCNRTLRHEREKAAPEIIKLTDELMQ